MFRTAIRFFLVCLTLPLLVSTASAQNWKQMVQQAGGFYSGKLDNQGWSRVFAPNAQQELGRLPQGVQTMLQHEIVDNPWIKGHEEMQKKLGKFRPEARQVFDLPYIPIPVDQMKHKYMSSGMSQNMRHNVTFRDTDGVEKVRYFIHPLYADRYKDLIETHGVRYGEYYATPTSSPRSLVVWNRQSPTKPIWVKVSLHAHLDYYTKRDKNGVEKKVGISRVQTTKKAKRSALVNAAFNSADRQQLARHKIDFMAEPASFVPGAVRGKNFDRATIFRELPSGLTDRRAETRYVPAFTFIKEMKANMDPINAQRRAAGKKDINAIAWMTKGLIEPLVRTYIHMGVEQGLQGELHTQNFLLEVKPLKDRRGQVVRRADGSAVTVPTGKVMVKDLDGFRMDVDMRIRNGKSNRFFKYFKNPFAWAKHSATQGSSSNPAVMQGWFNKLIRNVNGFTTTRTLPNGQTQKVYSTPAGQLMVQLKKDFPETFAKMQQMAVKRDPTLQGNQEKTERKAVEQIFDLVARAQFHRQTGIRVSMKDWGYGQNKGLNKGLNILRGQLGHAQQGVGAHYDQSGQLQTDAAAQRVLGQTFRQLRQQQVRKTDDRTWIRGSVNRSTRFRMVGQSTIEAINSRGNSMGYAVLKPDQASQLRTQLQSAGFTAPQRQRANHFIKNYAAKDLRSRTPLGAFFRDRPARRAAGRTARR